MLLVFVGHTSTIVVSNTNYARIIVGSAGLGGAAARARLFAARASRLFSVRHRLHRVPPGFPVLAATYQAVAFDLATPQSLQAGVIPFSLMPDGLRVHLLRRSISGLSLGMDATRSFWSCRACSCRRNHAGADCGKESGTV